MKTIETRDRFYSTAYILPQELRPLGIRVLAYLWYEKYTDQLVPDSPEFFAAEIGADPKEIEFIFRKFETYGFLMRYSENYYVINFEE